MAFEQSRSPFRMRTSPASVAALRYADHEQTTIYTKLFGWHRAFKTNHLKQMRKKRCA